MEPRQETANASQVPLQVALRPAKVYVESLSDETGGQDRFTLHVILMAKGETEILLERVEATLKGENGAQVKYTFTGQTLETFLRDSQAKIHGAPAAAGTRLKPGQVAGLIGLYFAQEARLGLGEVEVVAQAKTEAGKKVEARATAPLLRYTPQTRFTLPFSGTWWVAGGHEPVADVPHRLGPSQEFAYDFLQLGSEGRSFRTEGQANEDYYAYGQPILAAAAGSVVAALDGIPENRPGEVPAAEDMIREVNLAFGNHIILDHGHQEYTFYAHLQTGSVSVQAGQPVSQGQILGRCGNSGHSTEPHLHFHLMDGPRVLASMGLPLVFHDYFRGRVRVERGTLYAREVVSATSCATSGRSSIVAKVLTRG